MRARSSARCRAPFGWFSCVALAIACAIGAIGVGCAPAGGAAAGGGRGGGPLVPAASGVTPEVSSSAAPQPAASTSAAAPKPPSPCADATLARAARLHACAEACLAGDAAACVTRGDLGLADDGQVAQRLAADFFDRGCHYGAEAGCARWQGMVDAARAACSPTSTDACLRQGEMVVSALSARELDVAAADASLATACALQIALACELRGTLDVVREPAETWAKVALSSFERGCALGAPRACCGAADMLDESRGARRDPPRAEKLRGRAASLGGTCGRAGGAARPRGIRTTETELSVAGPLPLASVQSVVRASHAAIRACYERALARDPGLAGKLTTRFVVDDSGDPTEVRTVSTTLPDADVIACIGVVYDTLKFPAPTGGRAVVVSGVELGLE